MSKSRIGEALAQPELGHEGLAAEGRRQLPLADREQQVLDRIAGARRRRPKVNDLSVADAAGRRHHRARAGRRPRHHDRAGPRPGSAG